MEGTPEDTPIGIDAMTIIKFCILLIIGLVIISSISNLNGLSTSSDTSITFTQNPHDGETIQLDGHIYEFDNNGSVATGHTAVVIGATELATFNNFKAAVAQNYGVT